MALTTVQSGVIGNSQAGVISGVNFGVPIIENPTTISANYSISTGTNAYSSGPITVADGVAVTIPDGSVWTIV
jgi:hypothetical protein